MLIHLDKQIPTWSDNGFALGPCFAAYCGLPLTAPTPVEGGWDFELRDSRPLYSSLDSQALWVGCPERAQGYSRRGDAPLCVGMPALYLEAQKAHRPPGSTLLMLDCIDQQISDVALFLKSHGIEHGKQRTVIAIPQPLSELTQSSVTLLWRHGIPVVSYNPSHLSSRGLHDLDTLFHRFETVAADRCGRWLPHAAWRGCRIALKESPAEGEYLGEIKMPRRRNGAWKSISLGAQLLGETFRINPDTLRAAFGWQQPNSEHTLLSLTDIFGDPEVRAAERAARLLFKHLNSDARKDLEAHSSAEPLIAHLLAALDQQAQQTKTARIAPSTAPEVLSSLREFYPCLQETPGKVLLISASSKPPKDRETLMIHRSFKPLFRADSKNLVSLDITFSNTLGLPELYNQKIEEYLDSDFTFLVFCHDDVYVDDHNLATKLHLARIQFGFDIIGLAGGSSPKIASPTLWHLMCDKKTQRGAVTHPTFDRSSLSVTPYGKNPAQVDIVDGLFMAVNVSAIKASNWRFNPNYRFHHYDLASCLDAKRIGMTTGVYPIHVVHSSPGLKCYEDPEWMRSDAMFLKEYGNSASG